MSCLKFLSCGLLLLLLISDLNAANYRLCGRQLTDILDMLCVDGFNSKNLKAKKSVPLIDYNDNGLDNDISPISFSSLFTNKLNANHNSLMTKTRRRRHDGVAEECCRKSCDMHELLSYCL